MKPSRREFLAAVPPLTIAAGVPDRSRQAIVAPGAPPEQPSAPAPTYSSFDPWIELNAANVRHNVDAIVRLTERPILAVIKNNGYGAGVAHIGRLLDPLGPIAGLAVVKIDEAFALRDAGIRKPILLMGPFDDRHVGDLATRGIRPMVYNAPGPEAERWAGRTRRRVAVHVCVDTGIGRVGVPHREAASFMRALNARYSVQVEGTMMTFTEDEAFDREQLARFTALLEPLAKERVQIGRRHAASSYALFQQPATDNSGPFLDMVRPGMAIFGVYPETRFRDARVLDLRPALALRTRVLYVKQLRAGDSAGYNRAYQAARDVWIATLPVGHADGWPRGAAKGGTVRINDARYPIVATISASHAIVEIGAEPAVKVGDLATLFDWQDGSRPDDVAAATGVSVYDLLMHLNPLLERRLV